MGESARRTEVRHNAPKPCCRSRCPFGSDASLRVSAGSRNRRGRVGIRRFGDRAAPSSKPDLCAALALSVSCESSAPGGRFAHAQDHRIRRGTTSARSDASAGGIERRLAQRGFAPVATPERMRDDQWHSRATSRLCRIATENDGFRSFLLLRPVISCHPKKLGCSASACRETRIVRSGRSSGSVPIV